MNDKTSGSDLPALSDEAIARIEAIRQWLKQGPHEPSSLPDALATLETLTL